LRLLTLEGLASVDDTDEAYETVDAGEYFGGDDVATAMPMSMKSRRFLFSRFRDRSGELLAARRG